MPGVRRRRFKKGRDDDRIVIHSIEVGETTSYVASYEALSFEGVTGEADMDLGESEIREVLATMLEVYKEPPKKVVAMLTPMVGYVELMANMGVTYVTTSAGVRFSETGMVGARIKARYNDGDGEEEHRGWGVVLTAMFEGFDGYSYEAYHEVMKVLLLGESIDTELLRMELASLIKIAYNAYRVRPRWLDY
jgi:hypothetical protein